MIRQRKPIPRFKSRPSRPGDEYVFTYKGREYRLPGKFIQENSSPDGLRWIASSAAKTILSAIVRELAGNHCELKESPSCWNFVPFGVGTHHAIHKKMGGAFTDDRIWRNGERIRLLACPSCHKNHHNKLHWTQNVA